jgi:branched-chain amino acid transport system substrate-binding protein
MKKRVFSVLLVVLMVISIFTGCAQNETGAKTPNQGSNETKPEIEDEVETVKIGVLLPYSGSSAKQGEMEDLGIEIYTERFNEAGGFKSLNGAKVELIRADSTTDAQVGATEFQRLVEKEGCVAILGPINSTVASVTMPLAERYKVPYLIVNSGANVLTQEPYNYCFRANVADSKALELMNTFFEMLQNEKNYPIDRVMMVCENTDWGVGVADTIDAVCKEFGAEMLRESFTTNAADFSTIINKIKTSDIDLVIVASFVNDAMMFSRQMNEYDCHVPTIGQGGGWILSEYVNLTGKDLTQEAMAFVTAFSKDVLDIKGEGAKKIADIILERTGEGVNDNTANGYLDAGILYEAIEKAGTIEADDIVDAIKNMNMPEDHEALYLHPYSGVTFGEYNPGFGLPKQYNENQLSTPSLTQIIDGEFRLIWPLPEGYESPLIWPATPFEN